MTRLIEKYAVQMVQWLVTIVISLVVFIFFDQTSGQEARYQRIINEQARSTANIEAQLVEIQKNTIRIRAGMSVVVRHLSEKNPAIRDEIEWAEQYDLRTFRSSNRGGKTDSVGKK